MTRRLGFVVTFRGMRQCYMAESAGKARAMAARTIEEYWQVPFGVCLREMRVTREPALDQQDEPVAP